MRGVSNRRVLSRANAVTTIVFFLVLLAGCSRGEKVERAIVDQIHSCQIVGNCRVSMSRSTSFEWDKMYAFGGSDSQQVRDAALGLSDPEYREFQPQMVFVKNGKVVFQESEPEDVENPIKDEVVFESSSGTGVGIFSPNSLFSVEEKKGPDGRYYVLKQVQ
jgi:hypothetical protein